MNLAAQQPDLSVEIPGLLEDMRRRAGRAESARAPSAATTMAERKEVFRHAERPASVVAEGFAGVAEDGGN